MSAGVYRTYDAAGKELREDLMDFITDLSPVETPLFSGLQKSKAASTFHQWVADSTARPTTTSAHGEGLDVTFTDLTAPTRLTNYVQEIVQPYKVSQKEMDSNNVGGDPFARYRAKAMKIWKMKAEYSLIWGTGSSGQSGVAAEMTGLKKSITTNYVSYASGTSITETRFNDILQLAYNDVSDDTFEAYMSIGLKRNVSAFTAGSTKFTDVNDRRLINAVDVYESDVAKMVKLFGHRDMNATASTTNHFIIAIQPKAFAVAMLHNPEEKEVAISGPYKAGYMYGSLTLEYRLEAAAVRAENLFA